MELTFFIAVFLLFLLLLFLAIVYSGKVYNRDDGQLGMTWLH